MSILLAIKFQAQGFHKCKSKPVTLAIFAAKEHFSVKNNLQLITNLFWKQEAAIQVDDELSEWTLIKRGVKQGYARTFCLLAFSIFI